MEEIIKVPYNWLHWKALDLEFNAYKNGKDIYHIDAIEKMRNAIVDVHKVGFFQEWYITVDTEALQKIEQEIYESAPKFKKSRKTKKV